MIHFPITKKTWLTINLIHTRSLMKTADYTVHKPVSWWVIHVKWKHTTNFQMAENAMTQLDSFTICLKTLKKREKKPAEAIMGVFLCFTVLKMTEIQWTSALPQLYVEKCLLYIWFAFFFFFLLCHLNYQHRRTTLH